MFLIIVILISCFLLDETVVAPLRGADATADTKVTGSSGQIHRPAGTDVSDQELTSDGGYSASEEEASFSDRQVLTKNRKRTKSKNGSIGFYKSAYV